MIAIIERTGENTICETERKLKFLVIAKRQVGAILLPTLPSRSKPGFSCVRIFVISPRELHQFQWDAKRREFSLA